MKIIYRKSISSLLIIGLLFLISSFQTNEKLTRDQAIKIAEQFIIDNGYTSLPPNKSKLSYELFDGTYTIDTVLKHRHNSLSPKAFCYSENDDSWHIGFLYSSVNLEQLDSADRQSDLGGRAVIVEKNGKEIRIAHKTPRFSYFKKL